MQLVTQLTLQILNGVLKPGDRLPSVRALARRLHIHHNTVSAAYSELAELRLVEVRRGSGVYVSRSTRPEDDLLELDDIIRSFLETARKKGYSLQAIRGSVAKWLARQPPDHILIVEPAHDVQKILVHELGHQLDCGVSAATIEEVNSHPELLTGALTIATVFHASKIKRLLPADTLFVTINIQTGEEEAEHLKRLPLGAIVGLVSIGPTVFEFAEVMIASLRGEELLVRSVLFNDTKQWRSLARAADLLIADSFCFETVARFAQKPVLQLGLIPPRMVRYLRATLKTAREE
jgi:GntR family transcriptional regulator